MEKIEKSQDRRKRGSAGFTLIEIMIVVAIMGLLATLVTINLPDIMHRNRVKIAIRNIELLQHAIDMFYSEMGSYPKALSDLVSSKDSDGIELKIIKKVPKDPWGNAFVFAVPGKSGEEYSISSLGADGQAGGDAKNKDINSWELGQETEQ